MKHSTAKTVVRVLGVLGIVLSLPCIGCNLLSMFMMEGDFSQFGSFYKEIVVYAESQYDYKKSELEYNLEQETDPDLQGEIESEIRLLDEEMEEIRNTSAPKVPFRIPMFIFSASSDFVLFAGGAGLLVLAGWGRTVSLIAAAMELIALFTMTLTTFLVEWPATVRFVDNLQEGYYSNIGPIVLGPEIQITLYLTEGITLGLVFISLAYLLSMVYLLFRRDIREVFMSPEENRLENN